MKLNQSYSMSSDLEYVETSIMDILAEDRSVWTRETMPAMTNNSKWSLNSSGRTITNFNSKDGVLQSSQNTSSHILIAIPTQTIAITEGPLDTFNLLTDAQKLNLVSIY
jgi:hypothetical protein